MRGRVDPGVRLALLALAWLGACAVQFAQPALWPAGVYVGITLLALPIAIVGRRQVGWSALAVALLAFGSTGWRAHDRLAERLPAALEGRDLRLTGVIDSLPQPGPNGTRFMFAVEQAMADGEPATVPPRVSLAWYAAPPGAEAASPPPLSAGQRWRLTARLKRPHGSRNPHGFDLELWLFERGVGASGYVRVVPMPQRLEEAFAPVERARQHWRDAIQARVDDPRAAGVIAALAVGDQGAIHRGDWEVFRATGIAHLVSISGLHVTMFAWLAAAMVGALWRRHARLCLWLPAPHAARWGGLALAAGYAALAGWGVPAQRTVWMIALVVALRSLGLRWPLPLVLLAVAAIVAMADPWALLQPGFWLSFTAVALLIAAEPAVRAVEPGARWSARWRAALASGLHTQWVATIGLAPLTMLFFQQVSVVGFVANLLAIPLVTLLITPLSLLGLLWAPLWSVAAATVQSLGAVLGVLAEWPFAVWTAAAAPWWAAVGGLAGGALLVAPLPWRHRWLGLPLLLPLLWPATPRPDDGRFEAVAVDVGQGTAVIVRTRGRLLVYDTGPMYSAESDAGERLLLPLLRARGERRIDLLMLSHRDSDHVGGAASVLARLPVRAMSTSLPAEHPLRAVGVPHEPCRAGQRWTWDGVHFEVLHPPSFTLAAARANTVSCVLRIEDARGRSLLLTGDIEAAQEAALVVHDAAALRSTALLVPHHGSRTSSSAAFLDAVAPEVAVVQADYRSRFGHPAPDVLARYEARGIPVRRSDRCGAWTWDGDGPGHCERQRSRRYWHHGP